MNLGNNLGCNLKKCCFYPNYQEFASLPYFRSANWYHYKKPTPIITILRDSQCFQQQVQFLKLDREDAFDPPANSSSLSFFFF